MMNFCSLAVVFVLFSSEESTSTAFTTSRQNQNLPSAWTPSTSTSLFESDNPFQSLFGNVASKISNLQQEGMMNSVSQDQLAQLTSQTETILASEHLNLSLVRSSLESKQTAEERKFRSNLQKGYGTASPLHKLRLFDESNKEEDVRVTLYRGKYRYFFR